MITIASSLYNRGTSVDANGVAIKGTGLNSLGDNFGDIGTIAFGTLSVGH
ncbi:hypothetical protein [Flavobacterium branchiophilum]|nr:hypothetical protein [Flavobacterium branchiophilum]